MNRSISKLWSSDEYKCEKKLFLCFLVVGKKEKKKENFVIHQLIDTDR